MRPVLLVGSILLLTACAAGDTKTYRVPSSAMEPTIRCGRPAPGCTAKEPAKIVVELHAPVHRGDIVVFEAPPTAMIRCGAGGVFVKRIIGLPGERWSERAGRIYVDGRAVREPYVARPDHASFSGGRLPPRTYLVLGDNRAQSCDSRIWGPLPAANVIGVVVKIENSR